MATRVTLRRARLEDAALLRAIRNDPQVRSASWSPAAVEPDEHRAWLARTLADATRRLYVVVADGADAGQVRLDRRPDGTAEISIDLLARSRGRGLGREAIALGRRAARDDLGVATVVATIRAENAASQAAFAAAGFAESGRSDTRVEMRSAT
jgi:RimJ/RimL family protein N-acetyltransferase